MVRRSLSCARSCCQWPALALLLLVGWGGVEYLLLPDVGPLADENPQYTAFMRLRNRQALEAGRTPSFAQTWVPLDRISDHLEHAILVAEDDAFWDHPGYDATQIKKAFEKNVEERRIVRGASTITQQLARNLYLSPSRNPLRKAKELILSLRLEEALSKDRILEIYLNVIEWGDGIYGAEAASQAYFGRSCQSLRPEEAAMLVAIVPSPRKRDPRRPTPELTRRKEVILRLMRRRGYLSEAEFLGALHRPLQTTEAPS